MKKTYFSKFLFSLVILFSIILLRSQPKLSSTLTWTETTVEDFSDNILIDAIITNNSNGEIQLPYPMVKTVPDYRDDDICRFVAYDSSGNFIRTWVQSGDVFVQKYTSDGNAITEIIRVNEIEGIAGQNGKSRAAIMNDGTYIVVWANLGYGARDDNMYGQIFTDDTVIVGERFQINEITNSSSHFPVVFANNTDQTFWILYSLGVPGDYKIRVQCRNKLGEEVGEIFLLNRDNAQTYELSLAVTSDRDDNFIVVWEGSNSNVSTYLDIYLRLYNNLGEPFGIAVKVNDDIKPHAQFQPDVCLDDQSNFLVVWGDWRDNVSEYHPYTYNIYGQLYNSEGMKIRNNFRVNIPQFEANIEPDADFLNNKFQISWCSWNGSRYSIFVNKWMFDPKLSGNVISSIFDTGPRGSDLQQIFWNESLQTNTSICFRIKSAVTLRALSDSFWYGPTDTSGFYITSSGQSINLIHNGDQYIQYKAFLNTSTAAYTPILNSVSISYIPSDTIPPVPPVNLSATPGHSCIILNWDANIEKDLAGYLIYRRLNSGQYDPEWTKEISISETCFADTSAVTRTTYFYAISAIDSSNNESDLSNEVYNTPFGINIYVSAYAGSEGDGSVSNPFSIISDGIDAAFYGDNVIVLTGTYNESIDMKNGVSVIGSGTQLTTIKGADTNYIVKGANKADLRGFTLERGMSSHAIECKSTSPNITDNVIISYDSNMNPAIYCGDDASPVIKKNYISGFHVGIYCSMNSSPGIQNNIINAIDAGIHGGWFCSPNIINNTIIIQHYSGINLRASAIVKNNIIFGLDTMHCVGIIGEHADASYNNIWGAYEHYINVNPGPGSISVDPLFVNIGAQDYRLLDNSPCIDVGDPNPNYNDVDGSRNDMGAFGGQDPMEPSLTSKLVKSISVSRLSGFPGDTVYAFVYLDNPSGLAKADLSISYDPLLLTALGVNLTQTTSNFSIQSQLFNNGCIEISMESSTAIDSGNGDILEITFYVSEVANSGNASSLALESSLLFDSDLNTIILRSITDGVFVINLGSDDGSYIYVDLGNNGFEDGCREHPFNTIQEGVDQAEPGDTVVVSYGEYHETIDMKESVFLRGTGASVTSIIAEMDEIVVNFNSIQNGEISGFTIKGPENEPFMGPVILCNSSSPTISRNCIKSFLSGGIGIDCSQNSNALIDDNSLINLGIDINASNPTICNNYIKGGDAGIFCTNSSVPNIFRNRISGGIAGIAAVYVIESSPVIRNNWLFCREGGGLGTYIKDASNVKILNNIIDDHYIDGRGIYIKNSSNIEVINNTINTNWRGLEENGSTVNVYNNIIIGNSDFGIQVSNSSILDYNDIWGNIENYYSCSPGNNDISNDPLFTNETESDYHLISGSPCIDAGHPETKYNDLDGSRNDIGAYGGPGADSSWIYLGGSSLEIDSMEVSPLDTINIIINGNSIQGVAEADLTLSFDPAIISFLNANSTDLTKMFSLRKTRLSSNSVNLYMISPRGIKEKSGELIDLIFIVNTLTESSSYLYFEDVTLKKETADEIYILDLRDGLITVTGTAIETDNDDMIPLSYTLYQNYPNPFNPITTINYKLPKPSKVTLNVYNITGQLVETLVADRQNSGCHSVIWDASTVSSGIYFYRIQAGEFQEVRKMILLK